MHQVSTVWDASDFEVLGLWGIEGDRGATAPWFSGDPSYDCCSIFLPSLRAIQSVGKGVWSMEGRGSVVEVSDAHCQATGLSGRQSAAMVNAGTRYDSHHMVLYTCTLGPCAVTTGISWREEKWSEIRTFLGVQQHLWGFFQNEVLTGENDLYFKYILSDNSYWMGSKAQLSKVQTIYIGLNKWLLSN